MVDGRCLFLRWEGSKYAEMTTAIIIKYLQIKIDCGNGVTPNLPLIEGRLFLLPPLDKGRAGVG